MPASTGPTIIEIVLAAGFRTRLNFDRAFREVEGRSPSGRRAAQCGAIGVARARVARTAIAAMVQAYWRIGRDIVEVEQSGDVRTGYGEALIKRLADRPTARFGAGFGTRTPRRMRRFHFAFPGGSNLPRAGDGKERPKGGPGSGGESIGTAAPSSSGSVRADG